MDKKLIINIGRQMGSGGRAVARLLADEFGAKLYDSELLNLAAQESGFSPDLFRRNDEHKGFLRSVLGIHLPPHVGSTSFYQSTTSQESLFKWQSDAIRKAAEEGACVFVGRCADYVLRDHPCCFNVFITAPMDFRVRQVSERRGCDAAEARKFIERAENERATYYNYYTGKRWGAAESYHLCIDASLLGVEGTAQLVAACIRNRQGE